MLDRFDYRLLEEAQRDDNRTADQLASVVPLSPSAIARRLRRLRSGGWIARTIALVDARLTRDRLRALVAIEMTEHANPDGKARLLKRLTDAEEIQFAYEVTGSADIVALFDCRNMEDFNLVSGRLLDQEPIVRRYVTSFVKRQIKFAPFVGFGERGE
ncbi:MAG TPA: Lrp/AsnC family transcriptional regulator [Sphingomicrobium sp.]|jgi:DNA-binding Lrp family transcriptional regulator|nr:Lrp/AsnC family transcriptional regulator [Sphingomicrobium sp.]